MALEVWKKSGAKQIEYGHVGEPGKRWAESPAF